MVALVLLALLVLTPAALPRAPRGAGGRGGGGGGQPGASPSAFAQLWRVARVEAVTAGVTFGVTLLTAPRIYWGVLAGVLMGLAHFLHHRLHPRIIEVGLHPDGSLRDRHLWKLPPLAPHLYALRMDAELDFAAASALRARHHRTPGRAPRRAARLPVRPAHQPHRRHRRGNLQPAARQLADRGITLHISGIKLPVERVLREAGQWPAGDPLLRAYRTDAEALAALARLHPDPPDLPAAAI
jgi:SulP family sulfate permease